MSNTKTTKRALFSSVIAMLVCFSMLIGTTFAWFTDTASTGVNKIQAGNLDVALEMKDNNGNWVTAEGKTLQFKVNGQIPADGTQILWEPGCSYELPALRVVNKGNLALKYKIHITGIQGDAKLNEAIDWEITGTDVSADGYAHLTANASQEINIKGVMKTTAGNEYQGLSIDGISITVLATQDKVENDSFDNQYDKDAVNETAFYTLSEFNALTEIPAGIKNVHLDIGNVSLENGDVTIGNKDICDIWTWDNDTNHTVGEILEDGRKVYMVRDNDTIYSSNKAGITLYISGSVNDNPEGGLNQSNSHAITFSIPDASNVVFTKDFTVNGYFRMNTGWSDGRNLGGAFYNRTVKSVLFDRSTFNGIWIQNGGFFTDSLTLDGCTFNAYENKVSANDSNPLWFCNIRTCDVTVKNCTFKASRPIKVVEQGVYGAEVKILNNTFDMSLANTANDASKPKNDAIMFSTITNDSTLGNVEVKGNTVTGATSLLTFFNPSQITMADGATFTVSGNTLNRAKTSVEWKTATEYIPGFVATANNTDAMYPSGVTAQSFESATSVYYYDTYGGAPYIRVATTAEEIQNHPAAVAYVDANGNVCYAADVYCAVANDATTIYCKKNATLKVRSVGTNRTEDLTKDLTIYANGANFQYGEIALNSTTTAAQDITVKVYDAKNLYIWGYSPAGDKEVTVLMENCHNIGTSETNTAGRMFYISNNGSRTNGTIHATLRNCSVEKSDSPVYMNADGSLTLESCTFTQCAVPVNINYKSAGTRTDVVKDCEFIRCGCTAEMNSSISSYAAAIRFVKSGSGTLTVTLKNNTFENTFGTNGDILLGDYRDSATSLAFNANIVTANYVKVKSSTEAAYSYDGGTVNVPNR